MTTATYAPEVFNVANLAQARQIILTDEDNLNSAERWEREAPYLVGLMAGLELNEHSVVLDYGCGIGRLSKALIDRYSCRVVGADTSFPMQKLALEYVGSPKFLACHPSMIAPSGMKFDAAISVWVLQHCLQPMDDIGTIHDALKPDGRLFVVNEINRVVPAVFSDRVLHWMADGEDVAAMLGAKFERQDGGKMDPAIVTPAASERTYWALYGRHSQ